MKKSIIYLFLFNAAMLFAQVNTKQNLNVPEIESLKDSVDHYEKEGAKYYHNSKYDTAIICYTKADSFLKILSSKRKDSSDYINSMVTQCNIAQCVCREGKPYAGLYHIPWWNGTFSDKKLSDLSGGSRFAFTKVLAFMQFSATDCYREMNKPIDAYEDYSAAYYNLNSGGFNMPCLITYPYALKMYSFQRNYSDFFMLYKEKAKTSETDTVFKNKMTLYLNKMPEISQNNVKK